MMCVLNHLITAMFLGACSLWSSIFSPTWWAG